MLSPTGPHHSGNSRTDSPSTSIKPLAVTAVYAGSFDPFTLGHRDIAARAGRLYSEVIIAIGVNAGKSPMFTPEERKLLIEHELRAVPGNFRVEIFDGLLAHYAPSQKASVLIRGVRGITDIPVESQLAAINREQSGPVDLETVFMPARKEFEDVSSSATKELLKNGGDIRNYVSRRVELAMRTKLLAGDVRSFIENYSELHIPPDIAEKLVMDRWVQLAKRLRVPDTLAREAGYALCERYKAPDRAFHTLVHIAEGLLTMEAVHDEIAAYDAFQLGWFYHDSVYDPLASERGANERRSIETLRDDAQMLAIPKGITNRAAQLIEATINHKTYEGDSDGAFFIDTDLSILGTARNRYLRYADEIRQEYKHYDDVQYAAGRVQFLRSMLDRPEIYKTEHFQQKFSETARENLAAEIERSVWSRVTAVTGSIGAGKSTVMQELKTLGFLCEDADKISADLRRPGTDTYDRIVAHFGPSILTSSGEIDRSALGRIVFSDASERRTLEEILHPAIEAAALQRFTDAVVQAQPLLAYEVPLLFEVGLHQRRRFNRIVCVDAPAPLRIARIMQRDGSSQEQAERKLAAQLDPREKVRLSDIVITNDGDPIALQKQLRRVL